MALAILDPAKHSDLKLRKSSDFGFARNRIMVPVWGQEIPQAARFFPVVFMPRDGTWIPMALMGLTEGRNPFVSVKGEWLVDYIPAVLRAHPFYSADDEEGKPVLAIDESDPALTDEEGIIEDALPLFEPDGEPSMLTRTALQVLEQIRGQQELTWAVMEVLDQLGLLVPWQAEGKGTGSSELFAVDEPGLAALSDAQFLSLRQPGALPLVYSHLLSLKHFKGMGKSQGQLWLAAAQGRDNALFSGNQDLFIFEDD